MLTSNDEPVQSGLASWPLAMPAFFLGWIGFGVLVGLGMARRGHHLPTAVAAGAGLGPLVVLIALEARRSRRAASPSALHPGADHGGGLDVLILVQEGAESVRSIEDQLAAVEQEVGWVTVATTVGWEWLSADHEQDVDNPVVARASALLRQAGGLVPVDHAALLVWPGTPDDLVGSCAASSRRTLILRLIAAAPAAPGGE